MMFFNKLPTSLKRWAKKKPAVVFLYSRFVRIYRKIVEGGYKKWVLNVEPGCWVPVLSKQQLKISIIVPVYNTPPEMLKECVGSVINQTYKNWDLILVDDASNNKETIKILKGFEDRDSRINVIFHKENKNISIASNTGIESARGDFIGFLDHDDVLSPHALNEVVNCLNDNNHVKWVYSDEDFLEKGRRLSPHFKTDWNLYLLRSHNYITHFCVYESSFIRYMKGFRKGFEGAQDYDLALRASEVLSPNQIVHIPKILYHWRVHVESSSSGNEAKPYTVEAGRKALKEHLDRSGVFCDVKNMAVNNFYDVNYLLRNESLVSIIIPTRDQYETLKNCVESLLNKTSYSNYEIVLMDNQTKCPSAQSYLKSLSEKENIKVIFFDEAFNYSKINNAALDYCLGEFVVLLNNDTEVINHDWLNRLIGIASQPQVGCVGAKLLYPDNTIQHAGVTLGLGGYAAHPHRFMKNEDAGYFYRPHLTQTISAVTGACLAVKKNIFLEVQGLDEVFEVAYNDVDFCLRVKNAGYINVYCPEAKLYHFESKSRGDDSQSVEKIQRFNLEKKRLKERWFSEIENDPFYNPNLTRDNESFAQRNKE